MRRACAVTGTLIVLLGGAACAEPPRDERAAEVGPAIASGAPPAAEVAEPSPPARAVPSVAAPLPAVSAAEQFLRQERARRGLPPDDDLSLCGETRSATAGLLVAVCNRGGGAHADSGWVDFYQIESSAGAIRSKAELLHVESGSGFGNAGEVRPIQLGRDTPGFVLEGGYGNHGSFSGSLTVVALLRGAWREVARLQHLLDNSGSSECEAHPGRCVDLHLSVRATRGARINDLWATLAGKRGGRRATRRYVLRFDGERGVYDVPKALVPAE